MKVGDTVFLNSGSPPLKIISMAGGHVTVEWRDGESVQTTEFPAVCVHK